MGSANPGVREAKLAFWSTDPIDDHGMLDERNKCTTPTACPVWGELGLAIP